MGFFFEVVLGGLLAGVLYSLVALGFVLIFKASGVFNFAQGAMVLFAALTLVRLTEYLPFWAAFAVSCVVMIAVAFVIERVVLAQAGEPGRHHPVHGHARHRLLPGRLRPGHLGQ